MDMVDIFQRLDDLRRKARTLGNQEMEAGYEAAAREISLLRVRVKVLEGRLKELGLEDTQKSSSVH